jgi:hypothetical protein
MTPTAAQFPDDRREALHLAQHAHVVDGDAGEDGHPRRTPVWASRDAELLAADLLARWCPVVRTTGVIGELEGPPPPTVVLGVMPLLEKAYLAASEQHG